MLRIGCFVPKAARHATCQNLYAAVLDAPAGAAVISQHHARGSKAVSFTQIMVTSVTSEAAIT